MSMDTSDTPSNVPPQPGSEPVAAAPTGAAAPVTAMKPNGPVVAVMLATGIGAVVLGIFTVLSEASEGVHEFLEFSERVGPLSGVTDLAATAFLLSWGGLHLALRERDFVWKTVVIATIVMFAIAVVFTYPAFFEAFASD
jgi:hypothetical protein